jgi:hypothetical protein
MSEPATKEGISVITIFSFVFTMTLICLIEKKTTERITALEKQVAALTAPLLPPIIITKP